MRTKNSSNRSNHVSTEVLPAKYVKNHLKYTLSACIHFILVLGLRQKFSQPSLALLLLLVSVKCRNISLPCLPLLCRLAAFSQKTAEISAVSHYFLELDQTYIHGMEPSKIAGVPCACPSPYSYRFWVESAKCYAIITRVQVDISRCAKFPLTSKKLLIRSQWEVLHNLMCHPVHWLECILMAD